jgi:glycosyltransferase involved in cell wall biosynthesis
MKVTISVKGRFHAFYLAKELQKQGYLRRLITTYPKFETVKYGVQLQLIRSLLSHELVVRAWRKLPARMRHIYDPNYYFKELFDYHATANMPNDSDLFVGWSSNSLHSIRKAKSKGIKTIVERGSSHMLTQLELLREEYDSHGLKFWEHHPSITEKELQEYEEADYICVPSLFVKRTFIERGVSEKKLIHNPYGVDLSHFKPIPKQDNKFRVIFCGNQSIRKGIGYLLQAFYELKLPNAELWFIGSPNNETQHLFKKYDAPNIIQKGHFPEFELHKYYSQGSVFCMPSIEEGLAMVQPQAMACGLPLICTTNTGGEDLIEEGKEGFVIPIRSVDVIKEKILYLYEHPDICEAMGKAAMQKVKQGFRWEDYGERMIGHYHKILGIN